MESKRRLKNKLSCLFHASPCNNFTITTSNTSSSSIFSSSAVGTSSSQTSRLSTDIAIDPVFLPRSNSSIQHRPSIGIDEGDNINPLFLHGKIDRSLSLPSRLGQSGCRHTRTFSSKANLVKKNEAKVKKNYYYYNNNSRCSEEKKKTAPTKTTTNKKLLSNGYGFSSSSSDDFFSSEEELENFFCSRSFSSDSSEFYAVTKKKSNKFRGKSSAYRRMRSSEGFRQLAAKEEAKEEEEENKQGKIGIPVTKRSKDPYVDFCDSMVEMIVERQIFGAKGLEKLLRSYLSLNSPQHHSVILRAFGDISEVLFGH